MQGDTSDSADCWSSTVWLDCTNFANIKLSQSQTTSLKNLKEARTTPLGTKCSRELLLFKIWAFPLKERPKKYWLQQKWHRVSYSGNIRTFIQNNKNLCGIVRLSFPDTFRSCSTNGINQPLHYHNHSPLPQLFKHKLSLLLPLTMWLPRNQSTNCQNGTIFLHGQIFQ